MSDYLDRLIARSLALAEVVQPKVGSLFEPPSLVAGVQPSDQGPDSGRWDEGAMGKETEFNITTRDRTPPRSLTGRVVESPPSDEGITPLPDQTNRPADIVPKISGEQSDRLRPIQAAEGSTEARADAVLSHWPEEWPTQFDLLDKAVGQADEAVGARAGDAAKPELVPLAAVRNDATRTTPRGGIEQQNRPTAVQSMQQTSVRQHGPGAHPEPTPGPGHKLVAAAKLESSVSRMSFARSPVAQHHLTSAAAGPGDSVTTPESKPTIRISIGRIEVRATTPPAPMPRAKTVQPAPTLSLDEYLKQRRPGQR